MRMPLQQPRPTAHRIELCRMVLHHLQHCSSTASLFQTPADSLAHIIYRPGPGLLPLGTGRLLLLLAAAAAVC
jgi:hypothetical protein